MCDWKSFIKTVVVLLVVLHAPTKPLKAMAAPPNIGFDNSAFSAGCLQKQLFSSAYLEILPYTKYHKIQKGRLVDCKRESVKI